MIQQKVLFVTNDEASIQAAIDAQALEGWALGLMIVSGTDMVLLFSKPTGLYTP